MHWASMVRKYARTFQMKPINEKWPLLPGGNRAPAYGSGQGSPRARGANNIRSGPGCLWKLNLATFNCRTLSTEGKVIELNNELETINWNIVGLCEVRRKGEDTIKLNNGHLFTYIGNNDTLERGVGFLIHHSLEKHLLKVEGVSDRIIKIVLQLSSRYTIQIIQAYAPTSSHTEEDLELFYETLIYAHTQEQHHYKIVMGDFNAKVGKQNYVTKSVGKFASELGNARGDRLVEFAEGMNLFIMNSFYKKKKNRKWTWKGPNGTKNEIDFILTNNRNIFQDVTVLNRFNTGSDHRMVRGRIKLDLKKERSNLMCRKIPSIDIITLKENVQEFRLDLKNRFENLQDQLSDEELDEHNNKITSLIMNCAQQYAPKKSQTKIKKISENTKALI